jgi:hypothetical protein
MSEKNAQNKKCPWRGEDAGYPSLFETSNSEEIAENKTYFADTSHNSPVATETGKSGEKPAKSAQGIRDNYGNADLSAVHRPLITCCVCGKPFMHRSRVRYDRSDRRCCSPKCSAKLGNAAARESFTTPSSERDARIRAQGIVNRRLKLGWFAKPEICCVCGQPKRLIAHHHDYSKPDEVHWVCYGDHQRVHHNPSLLDGIPPFICDRKLPAAPHHRKGGRKGPTGNATGRAPLKTIWGFESSQDGTVVEHLACGHTFTREDDGRRPVQRRCANCRVSAAVGPQESPGKSGKSESAGGLSTRLSTLGKAAPA